MLFQTCIFFPSSGKQKNFFLKKKSYNNTVTKKYNSIDKMKIWLIISGCASKNQNETLTESSV